MRENTGATDGQFKKYLKGLLGDKDHKKVLESIAKVDKVMRISSPPATRGFSYYRGAERVNRSWFSAIIVTSLAIIKIPARSVCREVLVLALYLRGRFSDQLKK